MVNIFAAGWNKLMIVWILVVVPVSNTHTRFDPARPKSSGDQSDSIVFCMFSYGNSVLGKRGVNDLKMGKCLREHGNNDADYLHSARNLNRGTPGASRA